MITKLRRIDDANSKKCHKFRARGRTYFSSRNPVDPLPSRQTVVFLWWRPVSTRPTTMVVASTKIRFFSYYYQIIVTKKIHQRVRRKTILRLIPLMNQLLGWMSLSLTQYPPPGLDVQVNDHASPSIEDQIPGSSRSSLTLETEEREPAGHPIAKEENLCHMPVSKTKDDEILATIGAADESAAQAESSNLSNIEHRAVIKYFVKKGKTPKEIFEDMVSVLQESAPSYTMVKNGLAYFNKDESCEDDPRPGRPVTVVTEENVRKSKN
ncbi:hypothetical protein EVAR_97372_1 [Eumeta japonica]|uniref:Mos1 transposase HTH domain-containing protein n=1 Tax=Eumeta variegata TaxID=151549 RepID=A0A4C1YVL6_EUMVA|nr:hypothetical protein EVAR_97372_1 [Eumeta japonica]